MPRRSRGEAALQGNGGEHGSVAGAAGNHHLGARLQRASERLCAHHADDALAAVDDRVIERSLRRQRPNPPLGQLALEIPLVLLGADHRQAEVKPLLAGDLLRHLHHRRQVGVAAAGAGGSHQQRNLALHGSQQTDAQVPFDPLPGLRRHPGAKASRTAVGGAGIAADEVRLPTQRPLEAALVKPGPEHAGHRQRANLIRHQSLSRSPDWRAW